MKRALLALCVLVSVVDAAPKYTRPAISSTDPELVAAEKAWTAAAAETDRAKQTASWEAAAVAFIRVVDAGVVTKPEQKEAAYAAVLAWKNALNVDPRIATPARDVDYDKVPTPQPLDARDQGAAPDSGETTPIADQAMRLALDFELEAVLAKPTPAAATVDLVVRGYERLIEDARAADVRVVARARLSTLYRHLGDRDKALLQLRACVVEARATFAGSEWLARCERDLAALREPDLDTLPELLTPATASLATALEPPP